MPFKFELCVFVARVRTRVLAEDFLTFFYRNLDRNSYSVLRSIISAINLETKKQDVCYQFSCPSSLILVFTVHEFDRGLCFSNLKEKTNKFHSFLASIKYIWWVGSVQWNCFFLVQTLRVIIVLHRGVTFHNMYFHIKKTFPLRLPGRAKRLR